MADLASGAVSSLLGVISSEARLLDGVRDDVQFIKEEMESMNSFLLHLARTAPPGREHDEQVRTWMAQVRLLTQDCNHCIDHYLYRRSPDIHRARTGLRHYLWWATWYLRKLVAKHRTAVHLRTLKERAREVGERRLRYGVEIPEKEEAGQSSVAARGEGFVEDEDEDTGNVETDHPGRHRRAIFEPTTLDDYLEEKLAEWMKGVEEDYVEMAFMAIVAPDNHEDALALAHQTLVARQGRLYDRTVLVDISAVHLRYHWLGSKEILYYILRELDPVEHAKSQSQAQQHQASTGQGEEQEQQTSNGTDGRLIYDQKMNLIGEINENIQEMVGKLYSIKEDIQDWRLEDSQLQLDLEQKKDVRQLDLDQKPIHVLLQLLFKLAAVAALQDKVKNKAMHTLAASYEYIIEVTAEKLKMHMEEDEKQETPYKQLKEQKVEEDEEAAMKLKEHMEVDDNEETTKQIDEGEQQTKQIEEAAAKKPQKKAPLSLSHGQYEHILRNVFPINSNNKKLSQAQEQATTMVEDQIKDMIHKVTEVLQQLQEEPASHAEILEDVSTETKQKIYQIRWEIEKQMQIKWIVDKIEDRLEEDILIILRIDDRIVGSTWEEIRYALNLLHWQVPGVLIVTNTERIQQAKEYCYPPQRKPIDYSLVGLYHDTVLKLTRQHKNDSNSNSQIFRNILAECEDHEFCMKIFTHALHANPKRSNEELHKLHHTLQAVSEKSFNSLAKKMIRFSYSDLSKEYKSCLLYLAIFPPGHNVRWSTLIARWVVEGLITKEDWPTSVHQAQQCFDALVDRLLVYPGHIGATGKVKSCSVGHLVHGFITKIARKQHIVLTRLSLHLARHFSIFNDIHLGSSDNIHKFFKKLPESSPWSRLKVLDLEGCCCFGGKNQQYLKDISNKILLLKYLSLRGTDASHLPVEINNLQDLEVLDICQTEMPASATKHLLLLKLKRLLAGHTDLSPGMAKEFSSARVPRKKEKMVNMEVLSNVKASQTGQELEDIRKLWQLRKLGVVIDNKDSHLKNLIRAIGDLHECLRSLSITLLPITRHEGNTCSGLILLGNTSSSRSPAADTGFSLKHPPKVLESLSISGTTQKVQLLQTLLAGDENQLTKVTLSSTELNQDGFNSLAKLPKLRCLKLRHITYTESKLTFKKDKFKCLEYFLTEGCNMTDIFFESGAAPELKKTTLHFTNLHSLSGVEDLPELKELEVNSDNKSSNTTTTNDDNNNNMLHSLLDNATQIAKVTLRGTLLKQGDLQKNSEKSNIRCLELLDKSCDESQLTLNKAEFLKLNHLIVNCSKITKINFTSGSAPKLEKFVWTFTKMQSLSGIDSLPRLREIELIGDFVPNEVKESINKNKNKNKKTLCYIL